MERKIGETFEFEGKKIKVTIASNGGCNGCILDGKCTIMNKATFGKCLGEYREDGTSVKFVEAQESKKERFDPKTLKAFDKVIVNHDDIWKVDFFSHICQYEPNGWCQCIGDSYYICIPYNDDTKYLIGTTDEVPEYYRYWEE